MKRKAIIHHSVVDWDFRTGTVKVLYTDFYVSAPSCLLIYRSNGGIDYPAVLCRIAETLCIAQGEVRTWHRANDRTRSFFLFFRNQHALGGADYENSYLWAITGDWAYLSRYIGGVPVEIGHFAVSWANNEWNHWRTVYWNGKTLAGEDALAVDLYKKVAGEWVQQGETLYDTENQWADSEINRSGIGCWTQYGKVHWFDNTEIWGEV